MAKALSSNTFTCVMKYKSVNIHLYISSRATLKKIFTVTYDCVLPRTPCVRPKSEFYTAKRDDEHPYPFYIGVYNSSCWPWELLSSALTSSLLHQILTGLYQSHSLLTHFMLVQIFMGSFIFIHSAPTRASFDTRDPLPWHLVCHAFRSITLAFRGYRVFSCDVSGNWALLSLKRFLLFRRKNKVTDHVSENRHLKLVPYGTLHSIYQALVLPHFNYCNIVWGNCGVTLQDKLQTTKKSSPCLDLL